MRISAVIITFNEEKNIAEAIESVAWADEVLVVDSESIDQTREIAEGLGAKVLINAWPGFSVQKQFAVDNATNNWIFSLDADERVSDDLRHEILRVKESESSADGYRIARLSYYMERPIRHCGWYPNRQLRLFDRRKARWNGRLIHESVVMDMGSRVADLDGDLLHYSIIDLQHHHKMIGERYAPLAAEQMLSEGRASSRLRVASAGPIAFFQTYILKAGFLDGFPGFCIARFAAHHAFLKHAILYDMTHKADRTASS
jgi:glycosyltransferase involved in cell wall biosynthesis